MTRRLFAILMLAIAVVAPARPSAAAPAAAPIGVTITKAPGVVRANAAASVTAKTAPGASCTIAVVYKTTKSRAQGLGAKAANGAGVVSWVWKVGSNTTPGVWPVAIACAGQGVAKTTVTVK